MPLVQLLMNYMMRNMFPAQLHSALCQYHRTCRLNIWSFQSLSLDRPGLGRTQLSHDLPYGDPFEMDVLKLPGLRTLAINYSTKESSRPNSWIHHDEILPFVCMAPNLKHLIIRAADLLRSLNSLSFDLLRGFGPWEEILLRMANVVDLSHLRSLDTCVHTDPSMLSSAARLLKNLNRLYIHIQPWRRDQADFAADADDGGMIAAVCAFNPLQFLCLRGVRSVISLRQIFSQHGQSLKGLIIEASERARTFPARHDNGYKFPIFLDDGHLTQELADKPETDGIASCFRDAVINAAMDEKLAMGIWNIISSSQPTGRLKNLRITPFGSAFFSREEMHVLHHVSSSFLITRSGSYGDTVEIAEIGRMAWEVWREADIAEEGTLRLPHEVKEILNELWPLGPGQKKWGEMKWKSFPLQI
ncbi:hypothetical protein CNMCM5623_000574 [Aspergillus felis]|uniref:Uncharacterized protein n=1 Tax=Aspergillus felis TaxID=1287682 RepID=A0A8H6Q7T5_9EURO|nr:hypothetical protein CNMCM5623_000574 [Aspergillus felis]